MSKLRNIETIGKILDGTSKFQTRKTIGFSDTKYQTDKIKKREVGEIWEEVDATGKTVCWWEQKDGYRVKYNMHPEVSAVLQKVRDELNSFPNCPKETCTCTAPKPIDIKFRVKTGMCEDCTISHETSLKIQGKFAEYARDKMKRNAEGFFEDADKDIERLKESLEQIGYVNSDGSVDKWEMTELEAYKNRIDQEYNKLKEQILSSFNPQENLSDTSGKDTTGS